MDEFRTKARITSFAETDKNGNPIYFKKYFTFERNGYYFYLQEDAFTFGGIEMVPYVKLSPFEGIQCEFPVRVSSVEEALEYADKCQIIKPLKGVHPKKEFWWLDIMHKGKTNLTRLKELMGNREKEIFAALEYITMERNDGDYLVLRFHSTNEDYFDYEVNSNRITG